MAVATTYAHRCVCLSPLNAVLKPKHMGAVRAPLSFGPKLTLLHAIAMLLLRSLATYSAVAHIALVSILFHPFPAFHPSIRILSFFLLPPTNLFHIMPSIH